MSAETIQPHLHDPYLNRYAGSTVLLKVSGAEIENASFSAVVEAVRELVAHGVRVVLAFGGGGRIDAEWRKHHDEPRPKGKDGINRTSEAVMRDAVEPAHAGISALLATFFADAPHAFVEPTDIACERVPEAGLVGKPDLVARLPDVPVTFVGFIGTLADGTRVNVNADDVAAGIARAHADRIANCIMVTGSGGVLDSMGRIVPFVSTRKLRELVDHPEGRISLGKDVLISIDGGMRKKLEVVLEMLGILPKTVITNAAGILPELRSAEGQGTLVADPSKGEIAMPGPDDGDFRELFLKICEKQEADGNWKKRPLEAKTDLAGKQRILQIGTSILGGYSIASGFSVAGRPEIAGDVMEAFWAQQPYNGVGERLFTNMKDEARTNGRTLYAYSDKDAAFLKAGFRKVGDIVSTATGSPLWRWDPSESETV